MKGGSDAVYHCYEPEPMISVDHLTHIPHLLTTGWVLPFRDMFNRLMQMTLQNLDSRSSSAAPFFTRPGCPDGVRKGCNIPCHLRLLFLRKRSYRRYVCHTGSWHQSTGLRVQFRFFGGRCNLLPAPPGNGFLTVDSS